MQRTALISLDIFPLMLTSCQPHVLKKPQKAWTGETQGKRKKNGSNPWMETFYKEKVYARVNGDETEHGFIEKPVPLLEMLQRGSPLSI